MKHGETASRDNSSLKALQLLSVSLRPQALTGEAPCDAQLLHPHTVFPTAAVFKEHKGRSERSLLQADLQEQAEPASSSHV